MCMYIYIYIYIYIYTYTYISASSPRLSKSTLLTPSLSTLTLCTTSEIHSFYNPAKPSGRGGRPPPPAGRVTYWFCKANNLKTSKPPSGMFLEHVPKNNLGDTHISVFIKPNARRRRYLK